MKLELDEKQLTIINQALIKLPYEVVAPLIVDINNQIARLLADVDAIDNPEKEC